MKPFRVALLLCLHPALLLAQTNSFTIVPSPNAGPSNNHLKGVAAISPNDVWAVGFYTEQGTGAFKNLAMHWDGENWTITPVPNPSDRASDQLKKVAAVSSNDVWAVGGHGISTIFRWQGVQWTQVPRPPIVRDETHTNVLNDLDDIAVIASNDIWAVGWLDALNGGQWTLTMHWDGVQWTQIPSPNVRNPSGNPYSQRLDSVVAIASNNVWAVGYYAVGNVEHTLVLHWDGIEWSIVPSPDGPATAERPSGDGWLHGIAAAGPNDIFAVGEYNKVNFTSQARPLTLRWNGANWNAIVPPNPGASEIAPLKSVAARGPNDFFAVGESYNSSQGFNTYILHWNGSAWTQVPSETPSGTGNGWNQLNDIARDSSGGLWAVGTRQASFGSGYFTLVERSLPQAGVVLSSVVSRKTHTNVGAYDVPLPTIGTPAVESRTGGPDGNHSLVFTFAQPLTSVGSATLTTGSGSVAGSGIDPVDAHRYLVDLGGVTDAQRIVVTLSNISDSAGNSSPTVQVTMDVLAGDTSADRTTNAGDALQVRSRAGQMMDATNCRYDVNADGAINSGDAIFVKNRSGNTIP